MMIGALVVNDAHWGVETAAEMQKTQITVLRVCENEGLGKVCFVLLMLLGVG